MLRVATAAARTMITTTIIGECYGGKEKSYNQAGNALAIAVFPSDKRCVFRGGHRAIFCAGF